MSENGDEDAGPADPRDDEEDVRSSGENEQPPSPEGRSGDDAQPSPNGRPADEQKPPSPGEQPGGGRNGPSPGDRSDRDQGPPSPGGQPGAAPGPSSGGQPERGQEPPSPGGQPGGSQGPPSPGGSESGRAPPSPGGGAPQSSGGAPAPPAQGQPATGPSLTDKLQRTAVMDQIKTAVGTFALVGLGFGLAGLFTNVVADAYLAWASFSAVVLAGPVLAALFGLRIQDTLNVDTGTIAAAAALASAVGFFVMGLLAAILIAVGAETSTSFQVGGAFVSAILGMIPAALVGGGIPYLGDALTN